MKPHQEDWVAGRSKGHSNAAIAAKNTLLYIKEHPGICSEDLQVALDYQTNIPLLVRHKLIKLTRKTINRKQITYYWPTGINPPNNK